jgi:nitric oxide reductase activation protein
LAAHGAGQIEFGTYVSDSPQLVALERELRSQFGSPSSPGGVTDGETQSEAVGFSAILTLFPSRDMAERIFTTLENGRIDFLLRAAYRGLRRDLDFIQARIKEHRSPVHQLPPDLILLELLFRIAMLGGVDDLTRFSFPRLVQAVETIVNNSIKRETATVADSLRATEMIYRLLTEQAAAKQEESDDSDSESEEDQEESERQSDDQQANAQAAARSERPGEHEEPFNFWARSAAERLDADSERFDEFFDTSDEMGKQELEPGDRAFFYDEWDHELADYRASWCRVIERVGRRGGRQFVEAVRAEYGQLISAIRYQFQLMRPESLQKIKGEIDGEDFDLQAVIDYALDRRTSGRVSERLYLRRLRRERDVAVSFLLDMSSSTARTVSPRLNRPGAPARPSKRIIDIEKEGLVLMSEALEAVGDAYSIQGFTSEGRHNVKYYVIKGFDHKYSPEIEARIGGITYQNNTRLGAAIRHAAERLVQQEARTKLLIILSDGRPYDHDYGDSRYAREDTKIALRQARMSGVTPFCITIDRESEHQLRDMYGEVGYTIIDDVLSLPERLPGIYRRLTQ